MCYHERRRSMTSKRTYRAMWRRWHCSRGLGTDFRCGDISMNMTVTTFVQLLLWIWFLGCTVTWRFGKHILVEGMGIRSAEFAMLCLYSIGLISYRFFQPTGKWILFAILVLWFVIQFFCHWYYTIFGASEQKLEGYNECFRGTLRLIPMSDKRLIPEFYHIVLHLLILANGILCLLSRTQV